VRPIRVALSGSGTKISAHIGALWAIIDAGYTIVEIAGTSGGSICAALFACGMSIEEIYRLAMDMDFAPLMAMSPWSIMTGRGYCSGENLLRFLDEQTQGKRFSDLAVHLTIVSSDVSNERPHLFSNEFTPGTLVALASRASASIPVVFAPVLIGDAVLMDGGIVSNLPVDLLKVDAAPRIGIELTAQCSPFAPGRHGLNKVVPHLIDLMIQSTEDAHISIGKLHGASVARVETGFASSLDRKMPVEIRQRLFDNGYASTRAALKGINLARRSVRA
jgi:NTE family protein